MNPVVLRVGASVLLGAAILIAKLLMKHRRLQASSVACSVAGYENVGHRSTDICCLCAKDFDGCNKTNIISLPCKHKYHKKCIKFFIEESGSAKTCVECRRIIPDSIIVQFHSNK